MFTGSRGPLIPSKIHDMIHITQTNTVMTSQPAKSQKAPHLSYESKLRFPQSVSWGETFTIHVNIHGSPIQEITWLHNDRPLTNSVGVTIQTTERYSKLEIINLKEDNMGKYVVQANNSSGFFTANFEVIKSQPVNQILLDPNHALNPPDMFGVHVTSEKTDIQHPQSSIILTVPEGAVVEGETCTISGQIHTDLHNYQHLLEPEHYFITPVVEYEASSHILQPVEIKIPHCLHDQGLVKNIRVFFSHQDKKKEINEDATDDCFFKVEDNMIIIQTMKFGSFHCECSGIPSAFPICLDLWMTHKLYTTHHVVTLQPVLRLGLALQKDFDFMKARYHYAGSRLIMTKHADCIEQQCELMVNLIQEPSNDIWREWKSSDCMEFNAALLDLKLPSSYITSLPEICLSSKTGGTLKGLLNIKLSDPNSTKWREIHLSVDEEVTSNVYTESPPQLLYPPSHKQSHLIKKGENLRLELILVGKPLPEVCWFHQDEEMRNGGNISIQKSESSTVLEIKGACLHDAGLYQVKASNYLGFFETKIQVCVYENQAAHETLMAENVHVQDPDVFGILIGRQETVFLQHPQSSIILTIPKGSCPEDVDLQKYRVSCQVHTDLNNFTHLLEPEHCFIAPIIRYKTNIGQFLQPVEIKLRHCLAPGLDERDVKVFSTNMKNGKAIRKLQKPSFDFDDEFIRIQTKHFCLFDCQAHQRRCPSRSLLNLFMSVREHPQERIVKLAPVVYIGCAELTDFETELEQSVDPGMWLTKRNCLNLPGDIRCSRARTELVINTKDYEFIGGGGLKECSVGITKITTPCINSLPDYALKVPLQATYLTGQLEVTLYNDAGENVSRALILAERLTREDEEAITTDGKAILTDDEEKSTVSQPKKRKITKSSKAAKAEGEKPNKETSTCPIPMAKVEPYAKLAAMGERIAIAIESQNEMHERHLDKIDEMPKEVSLFREDMRKYFFKPETVSTSRPELETVDNMSAQETQTNQARKKGRKTKSTQPKWKHEATDRETRPRRRNQKDAGKPQNRDSLPHPRTRSTTILTEDEEESTVSQPKKRKITKSSKAAKAEGEKPNKETSTCPIPMAKVEPYAKLAAMGERIAIAIESQNEMHERHLDKIDEMPKEVSLFREDMRKYFFKPETVSTSRPELETVDNMSAQETQTNQARKKGRKTKSTQPKWKHEATDRETRPRRRNQKDAGKPQNRDSLPHPRTRSTTILTEDEEESTVSQPKKRKITKSSKAAKAEGEKPNKETSTCPIPMAKAFPEIIYHESLNQAVVVEIGGKVQLEAAIHGGPETVAKWYHLEKELHPNEDLTITSTEEKTVLSITSCTEAHNGEYALKAQNSRGFFYSFFKISVFDVRPRDMHIEPPPPDIFGAKLSSENSLILKHPSSEITLTIPKGAIPEGVEDKVQGQILVDLNKYQHLFPDEEYLIAPIPDYTIRNRQFKEFNTPVEIRIPHYIIDPDVRKNIKVYSIDGEKKPQLIGKDPTAELFYKIMEKCIIISLKHFTKFPCTTHGKQCEMEAVLRLYMASFGIPGDYTVKLAPKLLLGCATSSEFKGNVYLDPGMVLKSQGQFQLPKPHDCLVVSTRIKQSPPWKVLEGGSYLGKIKAKNMPVDHIFEDDTHIPKIISLPKYTLTESRPEKLTCILYICFQYKNRREHKEEIHFVDYFPSQAEKEPEQPGGSISQSRSGIIPKSSGLKINEECRAIKQKLKDTEPDMYGELRCETELLACLVKEDVLRNVDRNKLKHIPDPMERIQALFELICHDPIPRYKGFLRALVNTGQAHIVTHILQETPPFNEDDVEFEAAHASTSMVGPSTDAASNLSMSRKRQSLPSTAGKKCQLVITEMADDQPLDETSETVVPSASQQPPKTRARGKGKGVGKNKGTRK